MATKRSLIESALGELGLAQYVFDISPERMQTALTRFNAMAAEWDGQGIRVGYNLGGGLDDEAGIPDTAEQCFILNGALRIAPGFGKTPSQDTRVGAAKAWNALYVALGRRPQAPRNPALPLGAGNRAGVLEQQYFPDTTDVEGLNDGATEY